jgi:hypothetical protein
MVLVGKTPHKGVTRVVQPFDHLYKFALDYIPDAHVDLLSLAERWSPDPSNEELAL